MSSVLTAFNLQHHHSGSSDNDPWDNTIIQDGIVFSSLDASQNEDGDDNNSIASVPAPRALRRSVAMVGLPVVRPTNM